MLRLYMFLRIPESTCQVQDLQRAWNPQHGQHGTTQQRWLSVLHERGALALMQWIGWEHLGTMGFTMKYGGFLSFQTNAMN